MWAGKRQVCYLYWNVAIGRDEMKLVPGSFYWVYVLGKAGAGEMESGKGFA
jgi:hypothetical protein